MMYVVMFVAICYRSSMLAVFVAMCKVLVEVSRSINDGSDCHSGSGEVLVRRWICMQWHVRSGMFVVVLCSIRSGTL